jgi:hypothetical protein
MLNLVVHKITLMLEKVNEMKVLLKAGALYVLLAPSCRTNLN